MLCMSHGVIGLFRLVSSPPIREPHFLKCIPPADLRGSCTLPLFFPAIENPQGYTAAEVVSVLSKARYNFDFLSSCLIECIICF